MPPQSAIPATPSHSPHLPAACEAAPLGGGSLPIRQRVCLRHHRSGGGRRVEPSLWQHHRSKGQRTCISSGPVLTARIPPPHPPLPPLTPRRPSTTSFLTCAPSPPGRTTEALGPRIAAMEVSTSILAPASTHLFPAAESDPHPHPHPNQASTYLGGRRESHLEARCITGGLSALLT